MRFDATTSRRLLMAAALCLPGLTLAHDHGHGHGDASAIGQPGKATKTTRTIQVEMADAMRYTPSDIRVTQGETVRFVIHNPGQVRHEFNLGTEKELLEHLEVMKKFPDMEHDEPSKVTLEPGQQREIVWQFTKAGTVHFACLIPGHYEAGMKGVIRVGGKK
jgi:uncharacterized cupredoxin-like copper-binding protein